MMSLTRVLLVGVLLLLLPSPVFGWDWNTKVTVILKQQPLKMACELLEKNYGIHFSYSRDVVNLSTPITINAQQQPLKKVLEEMFAPFNIQFARIGDQVVLTIRHQTTYTVSGFIEDAVSKERLIGATVFSPSQQVGTVTNQYGFFSLTLANDTSSLLVSYIGYSSSQQPLGTTTGGRQVIVGLQPLTGLQEVVITGSTQQNLQDQTQMSRINVNAAEVKSMPKMLGEADLLRTLQSMPGITGGMEGASGLHVRGGSPDQNLILVDGTPVFNSSHLLGLFSIFNPDIMKTVDVYKGAFPARFGGRLSSVIDISLKDGDMQQVHGDVSIGLLAAKFKVEGPLVKDKTSFVVSARRSYLDVLTDAILNMQDDKGQTGYFSTFFYDVNVKVNHIFSPKDRIFLSGYLGQDNFMVRANTDNSKDSNAVATGQTLFKEETRFQVGWGNGVASLRWNHIYNPKLFSNITANYSQYYFFTDFRYKYEVPVTGEQRSQYGKYYSRMQNGGLKVDFDYRPNPKHTVKFGLEGTAHIFKPGVSVYEDKSSDVVPMDTVTNKTSTPGWEFSLYAEDDWELTKSLYVNLGLRASAFLVEHRFYRSLQPRLGIRWILPYNWAVKGAYTYMNQYIHLLTNNGTALPTDLWVPSTQLVPPMLSRQVAGGIAKTSTNRKFEMSWEAYYKTMDNIIEYKENASFINSATTRWDTKVAIGKGWSYGMEVLLEKKKGTTRGWIGYTLAWSTRQFADVNEGRAFPYKYDRRHDVQLVLIQQLGKHWEISANWEFNTGNALTLATSSYEGGGEVSPYFPGPDYNNRIDNIGERNGFRAGNSHRLDLSFTYSKQKKWWTKSWNFSFYNVYNQRNPFYYYMRKSADTETRYLSRISIPIIPSVTYAIKF
jgi:hypothetical protein